MNVLSRSALLACAVVVGTWGLNAAPAFADGVPTTVPTITSPTTGSTVNGDVIVTVTSTAPLVQFHLNDAGIGLPVAVIGGTASMALSTWGQNQVSYQGFIDVTDCNTSGCSFDYDYIFVNINNPTPTITSPIDGATTTNTPTLTAALTVTSGHPGLRLAVDQTVSFFDTTAPFSLTLTTPLADGTHYFSVIECSAFQSCYGPSTSIQFTVVSLHPQITSVTPSTFSPRPDGRADSTAIHIHLPDTENVSLSIRNASDDIVQGPIDEGSLVAGDHLLPWNGTTEAGAIAPDGTYTTSIDTTATVAGLALSGTATNTVAVDDTGPIVHGAGGSGATFYPVVDGYQDTWKPFVDVSEAATVWLQIYTSAGTLVTQISRSFPAGGEFPITWDGKNKNHALAGEGTFSYHFLAEDPFGNRSTSATGTVHLSHKRLLNKSLTITRPGRSGSLSTSAPSCTSAYTAFSAFPQGVWLDNECKASLVGFRVIAASYEFSVPAALKYGTIRVQSLGRTSSAPEPLDSLIYNARLSQWAEVGETKIGRNGVNITSTYGVVPAPSCIDARRHVVVALGIPNIVDPEIYDLGSVSIVLTYSVLG